VFIGGSNTVGIAGPTGWAYDYKNWLILNAEDTPLIKAYGGTDSWTAARNLAADVIANNPTHVVIEYAINDSAYASFGSDRTDGWWTASEALIVRLRSELPEAKLVFVCLVKQEEFATGGDIAARDRWEAICDHHDVEFHRFDLWLQQVLGTETPTEEQINVYHDGEHFTAEGHHEIFNMLEANSCPNNYPLQSAGWSGDLEDYQPYYYDDVEDWLGDPIKRTGADNDGETGTGWADNGTARESSTVDDTISFTGTFCSFGLNVTVQASPITFAYSIDGGAYTNVTHQTGQSSIRELHATDLGEHTVTIKVVSGLVCVNQFLAI
jgi:hypothetical protein